MRPLRTCQSQPPFFHQWRGVKNLRWPWEIPIVNTSRISRIRNYGLWRMRTTSYFTPLFLDLFVVWSYQREFAPSHDYKFHDNCKEFEHFQFLTVFSKELHDTLSSPRALVVAFIRTKTRNGINLFCYPDWWKACRWRGCKCSCGETDTRSVAEII